MTHGLYSCRVQKCTTQARARAEDALDREREAAALRLGSKVFDDWFAENDSQISEMGGCDSHGLLAALWAAWNGVEIKATQEQPQELGEHPIG